MIIKVNPLKRYSSLILGIGKILEEGRKNVAKTVNNIMLQTYWEIGREIIQFEQGGRERADYGSELLAALSRDLRTRYGKGFSKSNVYFMRSLYQHYPKFQTVSGKLSWSHYVSLLGVDYDLERNFYEQQCVSDGWSVRELQRQIDSALFYRVALSKDKKGVLRLARKGNIVKKASDIIKDPYVLEFLGIPEAHSYTEKRLESSIIDHLQLFLLELGKGFSFIGRQFRMNIGSKHFYVDLVFYHTILKCYVLIDLKTGSASHADVGQMNMYLNYFTYEMNTDTDQKPVGIILATKKDGIDVAYALGGISNHLFVSKYKTYLPDKKMLEQQLQKAL
jgi:predicted nuclease of restriction endonuclease-like (RecB) superfamily